MTSYFSVRTEAAGFILRTAILAVRARRSGPKDAIRLIGKEKDPRVRNIVLHRLFGPDPGAPYKLADCVNLLELEVGGEGGELALYCALNLIYHFIAEGRLWTPTSTVHPSVQILLVSLNLRVPGPSHYSVLKSFLKKFNITTTIPWKKALGPSLADAEHRCLRIQQLEVGDPTALVLMLDTFNEVLIQAFSKCHPIRSVPYKEAAGRKAHPDIGNWLNHPALGSALKVGTTWFKRVHDARVMGDLAHAKSEKGKPTKPVSHDKARSLLGGGKVAWMELLTVWKTIL
jgi:hypothetical protein